MLQDYFYHNEAPFTDDGYLSPECLLVDNNTRKWKLKWEEGCPQNSACRRSTGGCLAQRDGALEVVGRRLAGQLLCPALDPNSLIKVLVMSDRGGKHATIYDHEKLCLAIRNQLTPASALAVVHLLYYLSLAAAVEWVRVDTWDKWRFMQGVPAVQPLPPLLAPALADSVEELCGGQFPRISTRKYVLMAPSEVRYNGATVENAREELALASRLFDYSDGVRVYAIEDEEEFNYALAFIGDAGRADAPGGRVNIVRWADPSPVGSRRAVFVERAERIIQVRKSGECYLLQQLIFPLPLVLPDPAGHPYRCPCADVQDFRPARQAR